jgi:hypothetical protein
MSLENQNKQNELGQGIRPASMGVVTGNTLGDLLRTRSNYPAPQTIVNPNTGMQSEGRLVRKDIKPQLHIDDLIAFLQKPKFKDFAEDLLSSLKAVDELEKKKEQESNPIEFTFTPKDVINKEIVIKVSVKDMKTGEKAPAKAVLKFTTSDDTLSTQTHVGFDYPTNAVEKSQALVYSKISTAMQKMFDKLGGGN